VDAVVWAERTCRGWDDAGAPDRDRDGALRLTALVTGGRLHNVVWGTAERCRVRPLPGEEGAAPGSLFVDGKVKVLLYEGLGPEGAGPRFLVRIDGIVGDGVELRDGGFDFRVLGEPRLEIRIPIPAGGGDVIASVGASGVELRTAEGTFACPPEAGACALAGARAAQAAGAAGSSRSVGSTKAQDSVARR
jgi:hypothetical protein